MGKAWDWCCCLCRPSLGTLFISTLAWQARLHTIQASRVCCREAVEISSYLVAVTIKILL